MMRGNRDGIGLSIIDTQISQSEIRDMSAYEKGYYDAILGNNYENPYIDTSPFYEDYEQGWMDAIDVMAHEQYYSHKGSYYGKV
jgi:hypothetical protein